MTTARSPALVTPSPYDERQKTASFDPVLARTRTIHRPVGPVAYDCVKAIVVRDGSAILFGEFGQTPITVGDVITLGANTLCGSEPEDHITVTTVYLDTDYVIDQVFWQQIGLVRDRLDAQDFAEALNVEPEQVLHVGEDRAGMLMPWLDELVALSTEGMLTDIDQRLAAYRAGREDAKLRLRACLHLATNAHPFYLACDDAGRPLCNQAFFTKITLKENLDATSESTGIYETILDSANRLHAEFWQRTGQLHPDINLEHNEETLPRDQRGRVGTSTTWWI